MATKKLKNGMRVTTKLDKSIYYDDLTRKFSRGLVDLDWLCTEEEESYSPVLYKAISDLRQDIRHFSRETLVTHRVILHELENTTDERDKVVLQRMFGTASIFRRSFRQQYGVDGAFMHHLKRYNLRKDTDITRALVKTINAQKDRIKERRNRFRDEYIYLSAVRPYFFELQKKGVSFKDDMETHINLTGFWEDEVKDDLNEYVQMIIDFAAQSGKTNYIEARLEEYDRIHTFQCKAKEERKAASNAKQLERRLDKLHKFIAAQYSKIRVNNKFMEYITGYYKYDSSYTSCKVIVALAKIGGHETITYYAGQEVSEDFNESSLFFNDDEAILQECLKECEEFENVLCCATMQLLS